MLNWEKLTCPHCNTGNWICYGNLEDQTLPDVESCECYKCDKWFWLDENSVKDIRWDELEEGKTLEELLPESFCKRGRKNPDDPYEGTKKQ